MMKDIYRGHEIVVLEGTPKSAVIFESATGTELPTKVIALPDESDGACLRRARRLIDIYIDALAAGPEGRNVSGEPPLRFDAADGSSEPADVRSRRGGSLSGGSKCPALGEYFRAAPCITP